MTMPIDQQIAELKAELNNACLTPRERYHAERELEFLTAGPQRVRGGVFRGGRGLGWGSRCRACRTAVLSITI